MRWKTLAFLVVLIGINAGAAWYVFTRIQVQVFLEPNALAFRVGSQMPEGATDRGITQIGPATELPGLGQVILSSGDGSRSVRFDRLFHGDDNAQLQIASEGAALRFPAMPKGATLAEALVKAREVEAMLVAEGFSKSPRRVEPGCLRLDDRPEPQWMDELRTAFATGACGARPGTVFVFWMVRGSTQVSFVVQPTDGVGTFPDPNAVEVDARVSVSAGDDGR